MGTIDDAEVQELFWSSLLDLMEDRQVVPVIGQDLMEVDDPDVDHPGVRVPLGAVVVRRAWKDLEIQFKEKLKHDDDGTKPRTLHEAAVFCLASKAGTDALERLYPAVHKVLSDREFPIPDLLRKVARVEAFQLFLTTAPDPLLRRALDIERNGKPQVLSYSFSLEEQPSDLPERFAEMGNPIVYHLLGTTSNRETFALTEEDTLEFVHALQANAGQLKNLFNELRKKSLLIIGSGYSDWLARFFLRITRGTRLRDRGRSGFLADVRTATETSLVQFLQYFGEQTRIFPGDARVFVDELVPRWERRKQETAARLATGGAVSLPPARKSVFVSYANEDAVAAEALVAELEKLGVPVWFDKIELRPGDEFDRRIRESITRCSLFIPVLSRHVLRNDYNYFIREWRYAIDARLGFSRAFIVPCRIDDVPHDADQIPGEFRDANIGEASDHRSCAQFAIRVLQMFQQYQLDHVQA